MWPIAAAPRRAGQTDRPGRPALVDLRHPGPRIGMSALDTDFDSLSVGSLRLFQALLETGALHKAAGRVGISLAAANRELGRLREAFQDRLFVKAGHGMAPTPRTLAIQRRVLTALGELEQVQAPEAFDPSLSREVFRVAVADNGFVLFLGKILPAFMRQAPLAQLKVEQLTTGVYDHLRDGALDFAIFPSEQVPPNYHCRLLADSVFACLLRADHPLAAATPPGERPTLEAYLRHPRVAYHVDRGHESFDFEALAMGETDLGRPAVISPYFLGVPMLLLRSQLTTIVPLPTAEYFARRLPLAVLPTPVPSRPFRPRLIWHERVHASPALRWFRSLFSAD